MLGVLIGIPAENPVGADTVSFSSASLGTGTTTTPVFEQTGPWLMSWRYDCSNTGNVGFGVQIIPSGSSDLDRAPDEPGSSGSGTDRYYASGSFQLIVQSFCDWVISVAPSVNGPLPTPITYSNTQTGTTGQTQQFWVTSPWTMSWSYDCGGPNPFGPPFPNFEADIHAPPGDPASDAGPFQVADAGSGADTFTDTGVFSISILTPECPWSITITSAGSPAPPPPPVPSTAVGIAATADGAGYWIAYANGAVSPYGDAGTYGTLGDTVLNAPIDHIVATPDGRGFWLVAADGGIFAEGDAKFYGSAASMHLNAPIVDMAPTPDGAGYWLVGADGGIFSYGDAVFDGSTGNLHLNQPVVGMAPDSATGGYWLVARDGGIFAFDAPFYGSTGSTHLNQPVNGMAGTPDGLGYWSVASDGGIFNYGDAPFDGSAGSLVLDAPIVGMAPNLATDGYWLVGSDGGVFSYGTEFLGAG